MTSSPDRSTENALKRLIEHGYRFVHPRDPQGEILAVIGIRAHSAVVDVVRLNDEDDVTATRIPGDEDTVLDPETVLWSSSGSIFDVVDDLLNLSDHDYADVSAPTSAAGCWVSGSRGQTAWLAATA